MLLIVSDQLRVVAVHVQGFQLLRVGHDLTKLVELLLLVVSIFVLILSGVTSDLDGKLVRLVVDASLVQDVEVVRLAWTEIFIRHSNLQECYRRKVDFLSKQLLLDDLRPRRQLLAKSFHLADELFGLSGSKS